MSDPSSVPPAPPVLPAAEPLALPVTPASAPVAAWPVAPVLRDPVPSPREIPLDGTLERGHGWPILMAFTAFLAALLASNLVGGLGAVLLVLPQVLEGGMTNLDTLVAGLVERAGPFLAVNAVSQLVGFALLAWGFARLSSSRPGWFLRWRAPGAGAFGLAVFGLVAITPVVQWLSALTDGMPLPPWLQNMEESTSALLEDALVHAGLSPLFLLAMVALTPALCEELLFRGYLHRQVERRWGPAAAVIIVGVVFGLFHFSPTKALPLAVLGMWLGYLTWATGSLWPSMLVHFLNNAFAVAIATVASRAPESTGAATPEQAMEALDAATMPLWAVILGAVGTLIAAWALRVRRERLAAAHAAGPDPVPSSTSTP